MGPDSESFKGGGGGGEGGVVLESPGLGPATCLYFRMGDGDPNLATDGCWFLGLDSKTGLSFYEILGRH